MFHNNNNIPINDENVNIEELNYFTLNKKVFKELILIPRPKNVLMNIMLHLSCIATYKSGLIGVYNEISKTGLAKELGINKGHITRYLKQLEEMDFIKIFNETPLVIQILEAPKIPVINDILSLLMYVNANTLQFQFHINLKRKKEFFDVFEDYKDKFNIKILKNAEPPDHYDTTTEQEILDIFGYSEK